MAYIFCSLYALHCTSPCYPSNGQLNLVEYVRHFSLDFSGENIVTYCKYLIVKLCFTQLPNIYSFPQMWVALNQGMLHGLL